MRIDSLVLATFGIILFLTMAIPDRHLNRISNRIHDCQLFGDDLATAAFTINYRKLWFKIAGQIVLLVAAVILMFLTSRYMVKAGLIIFTVLIVLGARFTLVSFNKEIRIENGHLQLYHKSKLLWSHDMKMLKVVGIKSVVPGRYLSYYYLEFEDGHRIYLNPNFENWHHLVAVALAVFAARTKVENKGA